VSPIRPAGRADVPALVGVLARAFDADPVVGWVVRQDAGRRAAIEWVFRLVLEMALRHGVVEVTDDLAAVAVWEPPGRRGAGRLREAWRLPGYVRAVGFRRLVRVSAAVAAMEACRPRQPHWYLADLAVEPSLQGRGTGGALLAHGLERADRDLMPAYLESSSARNRPLYERHGFRLRERHVLGGDGPPVSLLWREPAGGGRRQPAG